MNETPRIPSPIPYLTRVPDPRAHNTTYDGRTLFMLVLMGLGSGRTNVLAIAQWVEDQRDWLRAQGFGRGSNGKALPAQATLYRFVWALEQQVSALEEALKAWALDPAHPGQRAVNLDGKYLRAPAGGWGIRLCCWSVLIWDSWV